MKISKKDLASLRVIHEGQNSLIYHKQTSEYGVPVIIKLLKYDHQTPDQIAKSQNEYVLTESLSVQGIRKAYEKITIDGAIALIFEYVRGETLYKAFVEQRRPLAEMLFIGISIARTLGEIHSADIVHKDINSRNILVDPELTKATIIDFGIASKEGRHKGQDSALHALNEDLLQGTLQYISPEQTGRMNLRTDHRTDLYSLGVTLYEVFTGRLPFETDDVSQLIHFHIARPPRPVHEINPDIPQVLSDIVMKLMEKNPENRYQSAEGLRADLENCLNRLNETGVIKSFVLAKDDYSGRFRIPQKLYGREDELQALINTFEWIARGTCEILMVSGPPGIGKSDYVMEIRKTVKKKGGYFIWGKHDQYQYGKPYSGLIQAFDRLVSQILTESAARLSSWKEKILKAVGKNGWLLAEMIPRIELIIGPQTPARDLTHEKARYRFSHVFQSFLKAISQKNHPLVLFIDNLQWADRASLDFLKILMTGIENQHLLFIGAYRDNEVGASHDLMKIIREMEKEKTVINTVSLKNLSDNALNILISETLQCDPQYSLPLADLVYEKTAGNPLFIIEFLTSLHEENLLRFDHMGKKWKWNEAGIRQKSACDNVADLMTQKIRDLPENTQKILALAACIGNKFDLNTLAAVSEQRQESAVENIRLLINEGLILPGDDTVNTKQEIEDKEDSERDKVFEFADDRIRQASYGLMKKKQKRQICLAIGRYRIASQGKDISDDNIFVITDAFNEGFQYITEKNEKILMTELNLAAGKKAKKATAYQRAIWYFSMGMGMLPPKEKWDLYYDLTRNLYMEAIEAEYLTSNFRRAEQLADEALENIRETMEKIRIHQLRILFYTVRNQNTEALEAAREALSLLHIFLPEQPDEINFPEICAAELWEGLPEEDERIRYLEKLPAMDNPVQLEAMKILMNMAAPARQTRPALLQHITLTMMAMTIQHGNSPAAAFAYGNYAILYNIYGDIGEGYRFGRFSVKITEQFGEDEISAKAVFLFNASVRFWKEHARETIKPLEDVFWIGTDTGEPEYAYYGALLHCTYLLCIGGSLEKTGNKLVRFLEKTENLGLAFHTHIGKIWLQAILNLQGNTQEPVLSRELKILPEWIEQNNLVLVFCTYCCQTMTQYLFSDYAGAAESGRMGEKYEKGGEGFLYLPMHYFYYALSILACYPGADPKTKSIYLDKVASIQNKMKYWADHAPENFQHKYDLIEAERSKICGDTFRAMEFYSKAIQGAREQEYIQDQALCYEREAEFYLAMGREDFACLCLGKARECYQAWGAEAKVRDMDKRYGRLLTLADVTGSRVSGTTIPSATTRTAASPDLDLISIIKASHTLSQEVRLENLLNKMIRILIENAGADKGIIIEYKNNNLMIQAKGEIRADSVRTMQATPITESRDVPVSLINYVARTRTAVVLNDAADDERYTSDPYMKTHCPRSLLCMPFVHQGKLSGLLYLENKLSAGAFTKKRLELLNILSSQVAISMENANLYRDLEQRVQERTEQLSHALKQLWGEMELAKKLQTCLLPTSVERIHPDFEIVASMLPADEVGGDFYEIALDLSGHLWLSIGDVSGHGITPGLIMMMAQTAHTTIADNLDCDARELVIKINRILYTNVHERLKEKHFMTFNVLKYLGDGKFEHAGAHLRIIVFRRKTGRCELIRTKGVYLNLKKDISKAVKNSYFELEKGDVMVLYTDGLTEAENPDGEMLDIGGFSDIVQTYAHQSPEVMRENIMNRVLDWCSNIRRDDMTLVIAKRKEG